MDDSPRRELGVFERAPALTAEHAPFNVVVVLRLAGAPEPATLGRAFEILQTRHPLLGVRIVSEAGRRCFAPATAATRELLPVPLRVVDRPDHRRPGDEAWRAVAEAELDTAIDSGAGPLLRATYVGSPAGDRGDIVLSFHHAIVDAASGVRLCGELLSLCVAIAAGEPVGLPAGERPPPSGFSFPAAFRGLRRLRPLATFVLGQLADEAIFRWRSRASRKPKVERRARCQITFFEISAATASRLFRQARRRRLTVASVLQAVLLLAVSRRLYGGREQPLRSFTFPDLRPYLRPPVPAERLGSYFAVMRLTVPVAGGRDVWELAAEIQRRVHATHRRGEKYAAALLSYRTMQLLLRAGTARMGNAALSYTGAARLERTYGAAGLQPITVLGFHAFVSSTFLGPEVAVQARILERRLVCDVVTLDADMDREEAERIGGEMTTILERAARGEEP